MSGNPHSNLILPIEGIASLMDLNFLYGSAVKTSEQDVVLHHNSFLGQLSFSFDDLSSIKLEGILLSRYDTSCGSIDLGIEPLVKAINVYGLPTFSSCEGHLVFYKPYVDRHPYVGIDSPHHGDRMQEFHALLQSYNQRKPRVRWELINPKVEWGIVGEGYKIPHCSLHPEPSGEKGGHLQEESYLRLLQEEAHRLASYIFAEARKVRNR